MKVGEEPGKIVSIKGGKGNGKSQADQGSEGAAAENPKIKQPLIHQQVLDAIRQTALGENEALLEVGVDVYPHKYVAYHLENETRGFAMLMGDGSMRATKISDVAAHIVQWTQEKVVSSGGQFLEWQIKAKTAKELAETALMALPVMPIPRFVAEKSDPRLAFRKLPYDLDRTATENDFPKIAEFLKRLTGENYLAFNKWVGCLFDEEFFPQVYPYIVGDGNDGKGVLIHLLENIFGPVFCSTTAGGGEFWTASLVHKRVIAFADCNRPKFFVSGDFKSISANDPMPVNVKHGPTYSIKLNGHPIVFSNHEPAISGEKYDTRRLIYCRAAGEVADPIPNYHQHLLGEVPAWLGWAVMQYEAGGRGKVAFETTNALEAVLEGNEAHFLEFYEYWFDLYDYDVTRPLASTYDTLHKGVAVRPQDIGRLARRHFGKSLDMRIFQAGFKKWLARCHDIKVYDNAPRFYPGLKIRDDRDREAQSC